MSLPPWKPPWKQKKGMSLWLFATQGTWNPKNLMIEKTLGLKGRPQFHWHQGPKKTLILFNTGIISLGPISFLKKKKKLPIQNKEPIHKNQNQPNSPKISAAQGSHKSPNRSLVVKNTMLELHLHDLVHLVPPASSQKRRDHIIIPPRCQGWLYDQPKQLTIIWEIHQDYHTFAYIWSPQDG